jgi:hypothetical protein
MSQKFADRKDFYYNGSPDFEHRTKQRLLQFEGLGMVEIGEAQFGIPGICSGLYIEGIWSDTDDRFNDYIAWVIELCARKGHPIKIASLDILHNRLDFLQYYISKKIDGSLPFDYHCETRKACVISFEDYYKLHGGVSGPLDGIVDMLHTLQNKMHHQMGIPNSLYGNTGVR